MLPPDRISPDMFQSAPLTKARGDGFGRGHHAGIRCFNPLPSQKQGETAHQLSRGDSSIVSIRSPHKSKGRPP